MKFFIPTATASHAERVWHQIRQYAEPDIRDRLSDRRIFRLEFERDGIETVAEVGHMLEDDSNELVFAILESEGDFFICTLSHGINRGRPLRVESKAVREAVDFES